MIGFVSTGYERKCLVSQIESNPIGVYEYLDYEELSEVFRPYDPRSPEVARRVASLIEAEMPDATVEHVGSSAIPGCAGKGIIDLLMMYPPGRLAAARDTLDGLGFQRQIGADPFPEERPLRLGAHDYDGETFRLHVHVIAESDPEAREQIYFRDRVSSDRALLDEYVGDKQAALEQIRAQPDSTAHNIAYNRGKQAFIRRILDELDATEGDRAPNH